MMICSKEFPKIKARDIKLDSLCTTTIVNVSTKTHLDGIQMNAMKLIMIPSIDTVQNMIISTLTRIEIMQICKWV